MEPITNEPRSLILSHLLYGVLLNVYPSAFRRDYGGPMQQVFRDCCRRALNEAGPPGLLALWVRTMLDTVQAALEEHVQRGVEMSREKYIKLSGWALMLGGLSLGLGFLAGTRPEYSPYNLGSLPIDRYANAIEGPLSVIAMFLLWIGFVGLFLRYGQPSGSLGRACLGLGVLGATVSTVGAFGLGLLDSETWWSIFFIGFLMEFLALSLFGLANLQQRSLLRWNSLPVLAGMWVPLYIFASVILDQGGGWVEFPMLVDLGMWLFTTAGLFALGYVLQSEPEGAAGVAAVV